MNTKSFSWINVVALGATLCLTACDGGGDADDAGATDGDTDDTAGAACDPQGPNPEQAALFNAPVEADVEIVQKTPTHPGEPGPENLP